MSINDTVHYVFFGTTEITITPGRKPLPQCQEFPSFTAARDAAIRDQEKTLDIIQGNLQALRKATCAADLTS